MARSATDLRLLVAPILLLLAVVILLTIRSTLHSPPTTISSKPPTPSCAKLPPSLSSAIIHYATSNTTPQQTAAEISVTARVLARKSPSNLLVFGLGRDSLMWAALNHGGRTVFLEEDQAWIDSIRRQLPSLEAHHVRYSTKVGEAEELLAAGEGAECREGRGGCRLVVEGMAPVFYEVEWDLIMVDAPTGYWAGAPGRMGAIYMAGMAARRRRRGAETDVFVHDVNRVVEDKLSVAFLCQGYLREQEGLLRHFVIPGRGGDSEIPFCPKI